MHILTGKVTIRNPKLNEPQSYNESSPKKYSVKIEFSVDDNNQKRMIEEALKKVYEENKLDLFKNVDFEEIQTPLKSNTTGSFYMNLTTIYKPKIVDKNTKQVDKSVTITDGSEGRVIIYLSPYKYTEADSPKYGIGSYLSKLQLISLAKKSSDIDFDIWDDDVL